MKTADLLQLLAKKRGLHSDYAIAKYLGISRGRVSTYRCRGTGIGDELAIQIANDLGINPGYVLAGLAAERAKCTATKKAWERAAVQLGAGVAAAVVLGIGLAIVPAGDAGASLISTDQVIHYTKYAPMASALWALARACWSMLAPWHRPGP